MEAAKIEYSIRTKLSFREDRFASKRSSDAYGLLLESAALSEAPDSSSSERANPVATPLLIGKDVDHE